MQEPTVSQAYAMIRALKQRGLKGDGEKIAQLETLIKNARNKQALLDIDKYFSNKDK